MEKNINLTTMSVKLELYVPEVQWKKSNKISKNMINSLIQLAKDHFD